MKSEEEVLDARGRLRALRAEIDRINDRLLSLLVDRAELVLEIAEVKSALGLRARDPWREEAMLDRLASAGCGPLAAVEMRAIFRAIFDGSVAIQGRRGRSLSDPKTGPARAAHPLGAR